MMAITVKNSEQIEKMRIAGGIVARTHDLLESYIKPGITTAELDKIAEEYILSQGAIPSFKGYNDFPASICVAVNEEVIHGIPGMRKLKEGDIIGVDVGAYIHGYHGDAARTHGVGKISADDQKLIDVTRQSFFEGIRFAKENCHLNQIGTAVQEYVASTGFSVVRDFVGHGIGKDMHEGPEIAHYRLPSRGPKLRCGMTLAIEPMVCAGIYEILVLQDQWTVITKDKKHSAHYENTILITDGAAELLTLL
jgi:methionyl aminopeptidase